MVLRVTENSRNVQMFDLKHIKLFIKVNKHFSDQFFRLVVGLFRSLKLHAIPCKTCLKNFVLRIIFNLALVEIGHSYAMT